MFFTTSAYTGELRVFIWEDYIADQVIENFYKETGIKVRLILYDSDQIRDETFAAMTADTLDLIVFDSISSQIFGKNNKLLGITKSEVPNLVHVDTSWKESCGNFGLPYFYGTIGITYDKTQFTEPPHSWQQLLLPQAKHSKHVLMLEDSTDILIPPLLSLGYNVNTENKNELEEAFQILKKQVPHILGYKYSLTAINDSANTDKIHMALAYSGDQYSLNEMTETDNWQYIIPEGPPVVWVDCMSIPANSARQEDALLFLNYLADPKVAAVNSETIYMPTPIKTARKFMSEEAANDPELFLPKELLDTAQWYRIHSSNSMRLRKRIFDSILRMHEAQN